MELIPSGGAANSAATQENYVTKMKIIYTHLK
jgi:hypothetical protein